MAKDSNFQIAALPSVEKKSPYAGNALLKKIKPDRLDSLFKRHKQDPKKAVRVLLLEYYKDEKIIASLSLSGTGGEHVTASIPEEVADGLTSTYFFAEKLQDYNLISSLLIF